MYKTMNMQELIEETKWKTAAGSMPVAGHATIPHMIISGHKNQEKKIDDVVFYGRGRGLSASRLCRLNPVRHGMEGSVKPVETTDGNETREYFVRSVTMSWLVPLPVGLPPENGTGVTACLRIPAEGKGRGVKGGDREFPRFLPGRRSRQ